MEIEYGYLENKTVLTTLKNRWAVFLEVLCKLTSLQTLKKDCAWVSDLSSLKSYWQLMVKGNNTKVHTQSILNY